MTLDDNYLQDLQHINLHLFLCSICAQKVNHSK